ncbi:MAG TPA: branched-chain amino acid transport system II carrier protein [Pseudomonas sp.]|jgi:LIVCS family branched-chain amino acid:cation transporter|uniref:Branched-chain amino acid transport system carrier protein n=1 Tax=Pseudomonas helleri TaxID=1608996 RepID=A0A6A7ZHW8_9PSED|nr:MULTISPECIES: branched-chain amino acid transport system II carrier protein [Pseudomonas]KMN15178.1 branched-chain amino acid ABC transporter substrate-binding protein [Pseudomonas helleri]MCU1754047.1 branched-chain amino acid transport system II carrier protein [Pseudomonas helleri]MQT37655.1 branched-chain amino acid transport system II carrier protein [Pseudomonas helleri]MQT73190.1 branched-chain amino acid transport system II carrier protein [Pseudomonas helleri]MQT98414.1 branched-ch
MKVLKGQDILALGFMTFALFVGAGNIIFPPIVGLQSGPNVWIAALGFLITAVGLPVVTVVALAKVGGGMDALSSPIGKIAGGLLAAAAYLAVGPLFATPRTATVSFEVGLAPLTGESPLALFLYSSVYFLIVFFVSLYPGRLLDTVGRFLAPLKIIALAILGIAAFALPAGDIGSATPVYEAAPFSQGFIQGYLTMDTLGALVFGIVIVNAIRSRGVESPKLITRYAIIAGLVAGVGLTLVYLSLFRLGSGSHEVAIGATNGAAVLHAYVQHTFGSLGSGFLAVLIALACLVTAVGLTCACAEYFSKILPLSYKTLVIILAVFSLVVSNLGLTKLIAFSIPVLTAIYPPCIVLVALSFCKGFWNEQTRIVGPVMLASFIFGVVDALKGAGLADGLPNWLTHMPFSEQGLAWLVPSLIVLVGAFIYDRLLGKSQEAIA